MKLPIRMWPKGQKWAEYNEIVPAGTPLSAIMCRDYWIHVESHLEPFDLISCVAEDGAFDVDIRLLSKTSTEMKFRLVRSAAQGETVVPIKRDQPEDRYIVKSGGRAGGWRVVERATGNIIADGLDRGGADAEAMRLNDERKAA